MKKQLYEQKFMFEYLRSRIDEQKKEASEKQKRKLSDNSKIEEIDKLKAEILGLDNM